jgi:hypothetical protein
MCNAPAIPLRKLAKNKPALSSQRCGPRAIPRCVRHRSFNSAENRDRRLAPLDGNHPQAINRWRICLGNCLAAYQPAPMDLQEIWLMFFLQCGD